LSNSFHHVSLNRPTFSERFQKKEQGNQGRQPWQQNGNNGGLYARDIAMLAETNMSNDFYYGEAFNGPNDENPFTRFISIESYHHVAAVDFLSIDVFPGVQYRSST
jgi:hypothetical protein